MKRVFAVALCLLIAFSLAACGTGSGVRGNGGGAGVQIANPFADYATLREATEAAGFPMTAPERVAGYDPPLVQLMSGKMIQLIFRNGDERLIIRKAEGGDDISGDYNAYAETQTVRINGTDVTMKGADGMVSTAVWCANGCSYALLSDTPMASDIVMDLIAEIA